MVCVREIDPLVRKICELHDKISKLENLSPSKEVDSLFTQLVTTCIPPHPIDVTKLCTKIQRIRNNLIRLCGKAESLLEKHYSTILISLENPITNHLHLFPYYSNYLKLSQLEYHLLTRHLNPNSNPTRLAFVGSGPLPLTSIILATHHLKSAIFHNYDIDRSANSVAEKLVGSNPDLSERMVFHTKDIMGTSSDELRQYEVVFLAALVGMESDEKVRVIEHLSSNMADGAILVVRSAKGARAFLYPVVGPACLRGFEVLSVYHPTDDVINSVVIARKCREISGENINQGFDIDDTLSKMNMIEELACDHYLC
ncbi:hypothetical protein ABFS83_14G126400 [Erythranthe nasuta]